MVAFDEKQAVIEKLEALRGREDEEKVARLLQEVKLLILVPPAQQKSNVMLLAALIDIVRLFDLSVFSLDFMSEASVLIMAF